MFLLDTKVVKEVFVKCYGGEETGINCYKCCCGAVLYGEGFEKCGLAMGGLSFGIDTVVALKTDESQKINIINSNENIEYECKLNELNVFVGDKFSKSLFRAFAMFKGNIKGAKVLISYGVEDIKFKRPVTTFIASLGILNNGKMSDIEVTRCLLEECEEKNYSFLPAELYGRKNTLVCRKSDGEWEYVPFCIAGYKMVLSYTNSDIIDIEKIISPAFDELKEEYPDFYNKIDDISSVDKVKKYIINECKRAKRLEKDILKNGCITPELTVILKESAYELFSLLGKNADEMHEMYKISESTGNCVIPVWRMGGICAFVKDNEVDKYVEFISKEYQKKVGTMPTLCICDHDDSGVLSDVKSE